MEIREIGEFGLIDLLRRDTVADPASVLAGIGDDAAAVWATPGCAQLLATDMLVEKVHFDLAYATAWQIGYKAVAVNLSDIAAMGGRARQIVVSIALPAAATAEFVVSLYDGMKALCREHGVNIVGGDTVASPQGIVVNVAVLGEVEPAGLKLRAGARPGDLVVVSNTLGDSAAGLALLQRPGGAGQAFAPRLIKAHLEPRPRLALAAAVAGAATSMNDISDGLASESREIAVAGGVGLRLTAAALPLSRELRRASAWLGRPALSYALYGGEDYELVFTVPPDWEARGLPDGETCAVVGAVTDRAGQVELAHDDGRTERLEARGYNHFR